MMDCFPEVSWDENGTSLVTVMDFSASKSWS